MWQYSHSSASRTLRRFSPARTSPRACRTRQLCSANTVGNEVRIRPVWADTEPAPLLQVGGELRRVLYVSDSRFVGLDRGGAAPPPEAPPSGPRSMLRTGNQPKQNGTPLSEGGLPVPSMPLLKSPNPGISSPQSGRVPWLLPFVGACVPHLGGAGACPLGAVLKGVTTSLPMVMTARLGG
jgi:hypothetical protein